jgi:hypothetical protein
LLYGNGNPTGPVVFILKTSDFMPTASSAINGKNGTPHASKPRASDPAHLLRHDATANGELNGKFTEIEKFAKGESKKLSLGSLSPTLLTLLYAKRISYDLKREHPELRISGVQREAEAATVHQRNGRGSMDHSTRFTIFFARDASLNASSVPLATITYSTKPMEAHGEGVVRVHNKKLAGKVQGIVERLNAQTHHQLAVEFGRMQI